MVLGPDDEDGKPDMTKQTRGARVRFWGLESAVMSVGVVEGIREEK